MIMNLDFIYPVGSIYLTMSSTNPSKYFGGTWVQISQGRVLAGAGQITGQNNNTYFGEITDENRTWFWGAGTTIGEYHHTLTLSEIPSHNHTVYRSTETGSYFGLTGISPNSGTTYAVNTTNSGGGQRHSNVQPTLFVMIWQRTA